MNAPSNTSSTASSAAHPPLRRTPLYDLHLAHGAKMVPFAGYEMPVQYAPGVLKEHLHTRQAAGLFDVSHMGQIVLRPRSGSATDAAAALELLVPADIIGLGAGRQRYTVLTNAHGGILDDLMVANLGTHLLLVVNAATKDADEAHLRAHLSASCAIEPAPGARAAGAAGTARRSGAGGTRSGDRRDALHGRSSRADRGRGVPDLALGLHRRGRLRDRAPRRRGGGGGGHAAAARGGGADRARGARQPAARSRVVPLRIGSRCRHRSGRGRARMDDPEIAPRRRQPRRRLPGRRHGAGGAGEWSAPPARRPASRRARAGARRSAALRRRRGANAGRRRHLRRLRAELGGTDRDGLRRARALRAGHAAVRARCAARACRSWWHRFRLFPTPTSAADAPLPLSNPNSRAGEPAT